MTINLSPLAASVSSLIASVAATSSPSILQLIQARQAGYRLGLVNMGDLDVKIQWWVDNSATLSPDELQQVRFLTMPERIREIAENNIQYFGTSQEIIIPDHCYLLKVSFQAKGGNSGLTQTGFNGDNLSGGGGGGGGYVKDFEIVVSPGEAFPLTIGDSLSIAALHVEAGANGADYNATQTDALGGKVIWNGINVDDSIKAIAGGNGHEGKYYSPYTNFAAGNTSNGNLAGTGGGRTSSPYQYYGVGGGACGSFDGESAITPSTSNPDNRIVGLGAGASSGSSNKSTSTSYSNNAQRREGGGASPFVVINFVKQPV